MKSFKRRRHLFLYVCVVFVLFIDSGARAAVPPTLKRVVRRVLVELNKREEESASRALN